MSFKDPLMRFSSNQNTSRIYKDVIMHSIQFTKLKFNPKVLELFYNYMCCFSFNNVKYNLDNMKRLRNTLLFNTTNLFQHYVNQKEKIKNFKSKLVFNSSMKEFYYRSKKNIFFLNRMDDLKLKVQKEKNFVDFQNKSNSQEHTGSKLWDILDKDNRIRLNSQKNNLIETNLTPVTLIDLNFCENNKESQNSLDYLNTIYEPLKKTENQINILNSESYPQKSENFLDLVLDENFIRELNDNTKNIISKRKSTVNSIISENLEIFDTPRRHTNPYPLSWGDLPAFESVINENHKNLPFFNTDNIQQSNVPGRKSNDISSFDFSGLYKPLISSQVEDFFDPVSINTRLRCLFIEKGVFKYSKGKYTSIQFQGLVSLLLNDKLEIKNKILHLKILHDKWRDEKIFEKKIEKDIVEIINDDPSNLRIICKNLKASTKLLQYSINYTVVDNILDTTIQKEFSKNSYKIQINFITNKNLIRKIQKSEMTVKLIISKNKIFEIENSSSSDYKIISESENSNIIFFYKNFLNIEKIRIVILFSTKEENLLDQIHLKQTYWEHLASNLSTDMTYLDNMRKTNHLTVGKKTIVDANYEL